MKITGIVLMIVGIVALAYGAFSYTTQKKAVDLGPVQISTTEHHTIPIPPILGIIALVGGASLLYVATKQSR